MAYFCSGVFSGEDAGESDSNMSKRNKQNEQDGLAHMSWGLIIFLWMCWWPLGLGLTIGKLIAMQKEKQAQNAAQQYLNSLQGDASAAAGAQPRYAAAPRAYGYRAANPAAAPRTGSPAMTQQQQQAAARRKWMIPLMLVLGALFAVAGLSSLIEGMDYLLWLGQLWDRWTFTEYLLPGVLELAGGAGLFVSGLFARAGAKKEQLLVTIVGPRDNVSLRELSAASGLSRKKMLKVVQSAIEHGRFGASAYVDMLSETLVVRGRAPAAQAAAQQPAKKAAEKQQPPAGEDKYQAILRQLREVNDAIPGEEMSAKISRMEATCAHIFELAKKDPKKEPQLQRFMDYYLPTSLKLLNTYASLDQQDVRGENITETKTNIENAMDLLVSAFENQLDKLYESDALDVSSDIAALQGMLNLDGLSGQKDFTAGSDRPAP